jgi:hypothetical protein
LPEAFADIAVVEPAAKRVGKTKSVGFLWGEASQCSRSSCARAGAMITSRLQASVFNGLCVLRPRGHDFIAGGSDESFTLSSSGRYLGINANSITESDAEVLIPATLTFTQFHCRLSASVAGRRPSGCG